MFSWNILTTGNFWCDCESVSVHNPISLFWYRGRDSAKSTGLLDEQDGQNLLVNTVEPAAEALIDLLGVFVSTKPTFVELSNEVPGLIQSTETGIEGFAQIVGVSPFERSTTFHMNNSWHFYFLQITCAKLQSLTTALNANSPVSFSFAYVCIP